MFNSIYTALSGMLGFSKGLDVIGNNVANLNTPGFKASELQFRDLFYRYGLSGSGGGNGEQVGQGVTTDATRTRFNQGDLRDTGNALDVAIDGSGFFILRSDTGEFFYTRNGQFEFNDDGVLVERGSQARVAAISGGQLTDVSIFGLRVNAPKPTAEVKLVNTLSSSGSTHTVNNVSVTDGAGNTRTLSLVFTKNNSPALKTDQLSDSTTVVTSLDLDQSALGGSTFYTVKAGDTFDSIAKALYGHTEAGADLATALGNPTLTAGVPLTTVPSTLNLSTPLTVTTKDTYIVQDGDTFESIATKLYGVRGLGPQLQSKLGNPALNPGMPLSGFPSTLTVTADSGSVVRWEVVIKEGDAQVGTGEVRYDGSGAPIADFNKVTFDLSGMGAPATQVTLNFGDAGTTSGSNGFSSGTTSTLSVSSHDGFGPGSLSDFSFDETGKLTLSYSNGQKSIAGQLGLALFDDLQSLTLSGGDLFRSSSDQKPVIAPAGEKGVGKIAAKQVELSNVDLTQQFTDIVVIQRGFQASSQVLSVANEMAQQLLDLRSRR